MKIEGPNRAGSTDKSKKKDGASASDGSFGRMVAGGAQESGGAASTQSIARVDSLLSIQAVEDPAQKSARNRMKNRANNILDELERLRRGLLAGSLTVGQVIDIADVVAGHREKIMDPALTAILDEIDMRAQIELAKIRLSLDKAAGG